MDDIFLCLFSSFMFNICLLAEHSSYTVENVAFSLLLLDMAL